MNVAANTLRDRNQVLHIACGLVFGLASFIVTVLCNLHWPEAYQPTLTIASALLAVIAGVSCLAMHARRPQETLRIVANIATQCASITLLLQAAFFILRS